MRQGGASSSLRKACWPVGLLLCGLGVSMTLTTLVAWLLVSGEGAVALLSSALISAALGGLLLLLGRSTLGEPVRRREALLIVSTSWLSICLLGGVPFVLGAEFTWSDALFEATSGFTTTGATILPEIRARLSPSLHLWRVLMHWLGGMGIVVLFVAVFPALGVGGKHLFRSEVPGPRTQGLAPRIRKTSSALWKIYTGFTLLEISMLCLLGGLPLFEALIHSLSTMATGGFSSLNGSVGEFHSPVVEWIVLGFMILAGMNFSLFYEAGQRGWRVFLQHSETRFYFSLLLGATLLCAVCLAPERFGAQRSWDLTGLLRDAGFQVTAVMTGTGFGTDDFELWPTAAKVVLMGLYFTGGCSGSTSGGMKLFRILVLFKSTGRQITKMIQPHRVVPVRVGRSVIREETRSEVMAFSVCFLFTVAVGALGVALMDEVDGTTSWMASLACVSNVGPGMGLVGPSDHFGFLSAGSKLLLSACMLLGRLEFFTLLAVLSPSFWSR